MSHTIPATGPLCHLSLLVAAYSCASRGDRSRSSSIRFDASAFESVSSNSSPVSRHKVYRYERCASVIGSSPIFHSGSRWRAGWSVSLLACSSWGE
jgi:hypothetical protein